MPGSARKARAAPCQGSPAVWTLEYRSHRNGIRHPASRRCAGTSSCSSIAAVLPVIIGAMGPDAIRPVLRSEQTAPGSLALNVRIALSKPIFAIRPAHQPGFFVTPRRPALRASGKRSGSVLIAARGQCPLWGRVQLFSAVPLLIRARPSTAYHLFCEEVLGRLRLGGRGCR